jgi:hypothetical protein
MFFTQMEIQNQGGGIPVIPDDLGKVLDSQEHSFSLTESSGNHMKGHAILYCILMVSAVSSPST